MSLTNYMIILPIHDQTCNIAQDDITNQYYNKHQHEFDKSQDNQAVHTYSKSQS